MTHARLIRLRRRAEIIELYTVYKASIDEICATLELSRLVVRRELACAERIEEASDKQLRQRMRAIQHERIEDLIERITPAAYGASDEDGKLDAPLIGRLLQTFKRQAELHGLDAPEKRELELSGALGLEGMERMTEAQLEEIDAIVAHVIDVVPEGSDEVVQLLPEKVEVDE